MVEKIITIRQNSYHIIEEKEKYSISYIPSAVCMLLYIQENRPVPLIFKDTMIFVRFLRESLLLEKVCAMWLYLETHLELARTLVPFYTVHPCDSFNAAVAQCVYSIHALRFLPPQMPQMIWVIPSFMSSSVIWVVGRVLDLTIDPTECWFRILV